MTESPVRHFVVDGRPVEFEAGDSVAVAILRAGEQPAHGGTLCLAGDCGNCLAVVDGVAYVRTCQTAARPGLGVVRHPASEMPPLPVVADPDITMVPIEREIPVRRSEVDVAVIGGGSAGAAAVAAATAAGRHVLHLDAADGNEVVAVYPGPLIVARTPTGMHHVEAHEIVVATGAAELHPVCPGNDLSGLITARAAEQLYAAGVDLGVAVAIGTPPDGVPCTALSGRLVRFEGGPDGRVTAVVTVAADDDGDGPGDGGPAETTTPCTTAILGLGRTPRDLLARMAGDVPVTVVGPAGDDMPLPPAPTTGVVCRCSGTTVDDLAAAWDRGFTELELLKRASLACLGTCQGGACLPQVRSWIADRTGTVPDPFTARPASRQITLAEAAADTWVDVFRRTPLHQEHLALGGRMDRFGGWWRPWHYGDAVAEYWAVRQGVSIGDVSTLGKLVVSGPDAVEALERLYPNHVADIKPGRSRYALLLNERGHVMDDGMILRELETRFVLSFTSGGAANAEMWVRDWVDEWGLRVNVLDRTMSLAAINVTGPLAGELLRRAGLADPPRFLGHVRAEIAGVPCHVMRLSFTGEASFELHHPVDRAVELWRALLELGRGSRDPAARAAGAVRAATARRATSSSAWTPNSTPRRGGSGWTGPCAWTSRASSAGRRSSGRPGSTTSGAGWASRWTAPHRPKVPRSGPTARSSATSPAAGCPRCSGVALVLGWQRRTPFRDRVEIDGREATVAPTPFYDPEGHRARL